MLSQVRWSTLRPANHRHRRPILTVLMLQVLLVVGACSAPSTVSAGTTTPNAFPPPTVSPPTPTLTPSPTPFPTVESVAHVAGWETLDSLHWVGYTFPHSDVTGIRAQWSEPAVTGSAVAEEFVWIGVGGWNYTVNNIIQVGTFAYFPPGGGLHQGIWYQLVSVQQSPQYPLIDVNPGDQIFASVVQLQQGTWQISLTDATNPYITYTKVVQFNSYTAYPSFIVEDPNTGPPSQYGPFYTFPHWGAVNFSHMQIRVGKTWISAASLYAYRIQMVRNGQVLATAGPLSANSIFTATQG